MKILIAGICGFVGSTIAKALAEDSASYQIFGIDNFSRSGSWLNKEKLTKLGITIHHGDIRNPSDLEAFPKLDWIIDAAANPSVLAGVDGRTSSFQLIQNNLYGTVNLLELCRRHDTGFTLISTSRVYSIPPLANLSMQQSDRAFYPNPQQDFPVGISLKGVAENYSTQPPVSLYGSTKVASEHLALEYGETFDFPVWIDRCGVMAGEGQFGHPGQGIFAFWIHSFREKSSLKYLGFGGNGYQVRDCLHPRDLLALMQLQFNQPLASDKPRIINVSGGVENSMSLSQLSDWSEARFGKNEVIKTDLSRPFDIPWMVLDNRLAKEVWQWQPQIKITDILQEIAEFAEQNPNWLNISKM